MYEIFKYVEYQCNVKLLWFETRNWEEKYAVLSIFENANWAMDLVLYRKEFFIQQKCLSWSDWWKGMQINKLDEWWEPGRRSKRIMRKLLLSWHFEQTWMPLLIRWPDFEI